MATSILTATTPEELEEQWKGNQSPFPPTSRPFAVWYNSNEGCGHRKWVVNDESGEACKDFEDMATALKTAAFMSSESGWNDEAKEQARALAKVIGAAEKPDPDELTLKIQSVSNGLAGVSSILERFARDNNNGLSDALDLLREQTKRYYLELGEIAGDVDLLGKA